MDRVAERAQIVVRGVVQGVGFRPFVYNLAGALGLRGYVTNTSEGVFIDIEGVPVREFIRRLREEAPPLSRITDVSFTNLPVLGYAGFTIQHSIDQAEGLPFTLVSPDVSLCDDCLHELLEPANKRYLYPFINCTNCGPRYSITKSVPYDRPNTTMASFRMCPDCEREYHDPENRRFHAQPNACPECGPSVQFRAQSSESGAKTAKAIQETIKTLQNGGIVAVKGLGGFHIACDATNQEAVKRLRERKRRSNKPFAVMAPAVGTIADFCAVNENEKQALLDRRRPIVLLRKRKATLPEAVSPNNKYVGCMLPYTPLHYLLFFHPLDGRSRVEKPHFQ
ncbi:MAG TPA: Sua5/YciO/YrdC/YwlC family protein, partial [Nitrospirota bacterium]